MTNYQRAKLILTEIATELKAKSKDKPYIRMMINDGADHLSKNMNLSEYEQELLARYVCKLHPKD